MPAFNFTMFVDKVLDGTKPLTIRDFRRDGRDPKTGDRVRLYQGLRRPKPRLLRDWTPLTLVCDVEFSVIETARCVSICPYDGTPDHRRRVDPLGLAILDGFDTVESMFGYHLKPSGWWTTTKRLYCWHTDVRDMINLVQLCEAAAEPEAMRGGRFIEKGSEY